MKKNTLRTTILLVAPLLAIPLVAVAAEASEAWTEHCARCHGADGTGNT